METVEEVSRAVVHHHPKSGKGGKVRRKKPWCKKEQKKEPQLIVIAHRTNGCDQNLQSVVSIQLQRKSQTWSWPAPPTTTSTGKLNHPGYWDIWTSLVLNWDGRWFSKECWFGFKAHLSQKVSLQVKLENGVPHIGSVYHVAVEGNNERCWNEIQPFTGLFGNFPQMAAWFHRVLTVSIADLTC